VYGKGRLRRDTLLVPIVQAGGEGPIRWIDAVDYYQMPGLEVVE